MSATPPASTLVPGQVLDRYELLCPVAQGGMAQVWVARLRGKMGFEKLVAIKTLVSQHAADPQFEHMFLDEARIIAGIRHPNVAQILDLGQHGDVLFLVLEWIEGDSAAALRRSVHGKGEKLPLNIVLRVVADSCAGLHAAHELKNANGQALNVVHRDVSPSNVLLSTSGEVKIIDFGVAKALDRISAETAAGVIKGKVAYMAPEQALGKPIDRRADVWSCGIMLYHLLAGKTPYEGDNQIQTLHRVVQGLPPDPVRGIPPEVAEITYTALSYARDGRFATADEMHRALESTLMKCCGPTTQTDVAAYVNDKLQERFARRKRTIQRALEAAEERRLLNAEFETAIEQTGSSMMSVKELKTPSSITGLPRPSDKASDAAIDALLGAPAEGPEPTASQGSDEAERAEPLPAFDRPDADEPPRMPDPDERIVPEDRVAALVEAFASPREPAPMPLPPIPVLPEQPKSTPPPAFDPFTSPVRAHPGPDAPLPPIPVIPVTRPKSTPPPRAPRDSQSDTATTRRRTEDFDHIEIPKRQPRTDPPAARVAIPKAPPLPQISAAADPPLIPRFDSISDYASKFGTRKRGPMIILGFLAALALLGYGAWLAWDRMNTERNMVQPP